MTRMAIEALQAKTEGDLISRQAANKDCWSEVTDE